MNKDVSLVIENIIKIAALTKILVKKNIITDEEIQSEINEISNSLIVHFEDLIKSNDINNNGDTNG